MRQLKIAGVITMSQKKEDILDAATALFSKFGYHSVGVDLIIKESGVAKMTFYKHFPSKVDLVHKVLSRRDQMLRKSIGLYIKPSDIPLKKLKSVFDWYEDWMNSEGFHGCMFIKASEEFVETNCKIREASKIHKHWFTGFLDRIISELPVNDSLKIAKHVVILLEGLTVRSNMYNTYSRSELRFSLECVIQLIESKMKS
jgi:AcrR family transcriptional regulator